MLTVKAKHIDLIDKAQEEVKAVMRKQHRNQDDFFHIWVLNESMEQFHKISLVIKITLGSIAGFSLLVGGIGIMNMMLVSVTERTREIGLRKAIGAKRRDILLQFLVEAVAICSIGGTLGIGLGIGAGHGMANIAVNIVKVVPEWPTVISTQWMVISVAVSAAIGISFGLYPAVKAARLSPIEALRTE
jgi:putative ABC transport system permease protein